MMSNSTEKTSAETAPRVESDCVDLLCRLQHIVNELVEAEHRPNDEDAMDRALQMLSIFLDFADEHFEDRVAIGLAERVREMVTRTNKLKVSLARVERPGWRRILGKSPQDEFEVRADYVQLGVDYGKLCHAMLKKCLSLCPPDSPRQELLKEATELFLTELNTKW